ncbi:MAG: 5-(carboxyamino)imidazole ribonucleotide synthase [Actinobacteria bacterium]|nr:5-(carboxyamino)imidazole ribonucleotide synthase [Actinomycetota bacterium]
MVPSRTDLEDLHSKQRWETATARVAMIGAGQLARMTHQAAVDLGIELRVLAGSTDDSAVTAGAPYQLGSFTDIVDLEAVAGGADVVTFDHELVPTSTLSLLQQRGYLLRPGPAALSLAQDKLKARQKLARSGFPTPAFASVSSISEVNNFAELHGWPVVLKTRRGGYDGRGVYVIENWKQLPDFLRNECNKGNGNRELLVEQFVDITAELSVLVARTSTGEITTYPAVQTIQLDGILRYLLMPAPLPIHILRKANEMAGSIANHIDATGILAVEMFLTTSGQLLINELALRPHNSGHATIEACITSQFHQHLRAILDWPLGSTDMRVPAAAMVNLIGSDPISEFHTNLPKALSVPSVAVHLYGKIPRVHRKLGHVTATGESIEEAFQRAAQAARYFNIFIQAHDTQ